MQNHNNILIADDESLTRRSLYEILKREGYKVLMSVNGEEALEMVEKESPAVVLADLKMPKLDGLSLLKKIKEKHPHTDVVLMTAYGSIENAVEAMKEGAFDYVTKPIIDNEIKIIIKRIFDQKKILDENEILKRQVAQAGRDRFHDLIGRNHKMQRVYSLIETVAPTNATIMIEGESGTGKRLVAHAVHFSDPHRKDKPFIEVSCGALPESLLESELFGHVKGSFTSAVKDREGRFEAADGGTIFLDEIDTFSPKLQVKLLRILQEGDFEKVGDTNTIKVDVRVVVATNQDLRQLISKGQFREDLYYRLNVIPLSVPPLRERRDDIPLLVEHFLKKCAAKVRQRKVKTVSSQSLRLLVSYDWPGNVRELENVIERAVILSKGDVIHPEDLPDNFRQIKVEHRDIAIDDSSSLKDALELSERKIIEDALEKCRGNRKKAAEALGINRTTLYNKMKKLGIQE